MTGLSAHEAAASLARDPRDLGLHAQPIVDTVTGEVAGYELLTRLPLDWRVGPEELFRAADRSGLSPRLTCHVLELAVHLRDELPQRSFLTFNCSPSDLTDPAVVSTMSRLDLRRVFVELTEVAWPDDTGSVLRAADVVRAQGGRIAADDVGAGYAGLLQLIRLRPELVKVDRQIVQRIGRDVAAGALVEMLGALADRLDAWVVAEGVEDTAQLSRLIELGVPLVQGYYLGRPVPPWAGCDHPEEVRRWGRRHESHQHVAAHQRAPMPGELVLGRAGEVVGIRLDTTDGPVQVAPLTMDGSTPVRAALLRAMSRRGPMLRMTPLVLTDATGRPTGVVPVERLVELLATAEIPVPVQGGADRPTPAPRLPRQQG